MDAQSDTLFVILARGGSKRLPHKNLLEVGGVPLIGRAVRNAVWAATLMGQSPNVIVSTDDEAIARTAREWGARTPFVRPAHLADDNATSRDALLHAVETMEAAGERFREVVLMQPTSPLALPRDIVRAIERERKHPEDSVVTARHATDQDEPPIRFGLSGDRIVEHAPERVALNGVAYVCSPRWLREHANFCISGETRAVLTPGDRSVDVDTQANLDRARVLWQRRLPWQPTHCTIVARLTLGGTPDPDAIDEAVSAAATAGADAVRLPSPIGESAIACLERCRREGVRCLLDATSVDAADRLDEAEADALVLAGTALEDPAVIRRAAATGRPVVLAADSANEARTEPATKVLRDSRCTDWAIMRSWESMTADTRLVECPFDSEAIPALVESIRRRNAEADSASGQRAADTGEDR